MERTATDDRTVVATLGDAELLDVLIEIDGVLVKQPPGSNVLVDQGTDYRNVPRAC
jgi:hypothetical protein